MDSIQYELIDKQFRLHGEISFMGYDFTKNHIMQTASE